MLLKRLFDFTTSFVLLVLLFPFIAILILLCTIASGDIGIFYQKRIGYQGKPFTIYKLRTIIGESNGSITIENSQQISSIGKVLRKYKLDELPQLWNIIVGDMSFVGPRPDVPGYADRLKGKDRKILELRPGIFGPAQLKYYNEGQILTKVLHPKTYNDEVLWPDKVRINLSYAEKRTFVHDLLIMYKTVMVLFLKKKEDDCKKQDCP